MSDDLSGFTVNHKDCNKLNNKPENLEKITQRENCLHAVRNGRARDQGGENNPMAKLNVEKVMYIRSRNRDGVTAVALAKELGVSAGTISQVILQRTWRDVA
jgi:hypothetical protein